MKKITAFYSNTMIQGPDNEVLLIMKLLHEASSKQTRRSARVEYPDTKDYDRHTFSRRD